MNNISLLIADDHMLFLDGIRRILCDEDNITLMGEALNGKDLLDMLHKNKPEVILLDINMPVMNGFDTIKFIKMSYPEIKIIILSTYNDEHLIEKAKGLGANGYLLKTASKEELIETVNLVAKGHSCFPYRQPNAKQLSNMDNRFWVQYSLTKREGEILEKIKAGQTNQQIANSLFLSIYTVETHRKNIMQKLQLKTTAALMKFIFENNI